MAKTKPIIIPCPQCGQGFETRRADGRRFDTCPICRKGHCVVCGGKIDLSRGRKNTCSDICHKLRLKRNDLTHYAKKITLDPDLHKRRHKAAKEKREADPKLKQAYLEKERQRNKQRAQDPEYQAKRQAYQAKRWQNLRDELLYQRQLFWESLTEEQKKLRLDKQRQSTREWRKRWRSELIKDPAAHAEYIKKMRQWTRAQQQQQALNELLAQTSKLTEDKKNE